jgi:hypothetical protein
MKWILKGLCFAAIFVLAVLGLGWVTMSLWNWLMPAIFGLAIISFWQAIGLLILCKILFGKFHKGGHCGCGGGWRNRKQGYWRSRWESKMANMTEEERQKFKQGMSKCGWMNDCETEEKK